MIFNFHELQEFIRAQEVRVLDFKIVDLAGRWRHLSIPACRLNQEIFQQGFGFDGSNYGYSKIENSDMVYIPDLKTAFLDPFNEEKTLSFLGRVYEISGGMQFQSHQDPRAIMQKSVNYLKDIGLADEFIIGPEFEFYIFDNIRYQNSMQKAYYTIDSLQAHWSMGDADSNQGYKVRKKGGYHIDAPNDIHRDLRNKMTLALEENGVPVKYHHHEVGGPGQQEIELKMGEAFEAADYSLLIKYFIKNIAFKAGKTATFMPKPLAGEAGNGFHVHMQLFKKGQTIFSDDNGLAGLSKEALHFMGGVLYHAPALMGIVAPSTNSYKRLVKGYEAPVAICFGSSNRSAVIRIPSYARDADKRRFEFRAPDSSGNPYLTYAAILMAGLDGVKREFDPVALGYGPVEQNVYLLKSLEKIRFLPSNLEQALLALENDHGFLLEGDVFTCEFIKNWIKVKRSEQQEIDYYPHPKEFELYYDL